MMGAQGIIGTNRQSHERNTLMRPGKKTVRLRFLGNLRSGAEPRLDLAIIRLE
jgi:hypothetical protein